MNTLFIIPKCKYEISSFRISVNSIWQLYLFLYYSGNILSKLTIASDKADTSAYMLSYITFEFSQMLKKFIQLF